MASRGWSCIPPWQPRSLSKFQCRLHPLPHYHLPREWKRLPGSHKSTDTAPFFNPAHTCVNKPSPVVWRDLDTKPISCNLQMWNHKFLKKRVNFQSVALEPHRDFTTPSIHRLIFLKIFLWARQNYARIKVKPEVPTETSVQGTKWHMLGISNSEKPQPVEWSSNYAVRLTSIYFSSFPKSYP